MSQPTQRVAVITVHGVADQVPGQTVRELARLLGHGSGGVPRYVEGELHDIIVPVAPLKSLQTSQRHSPDHGALTNGAAPRAPPEPLDTPGQPSDFYLSRRRTVPLEHDLGLALTDHLLSRYQPAERDGLYESTRISLRRQADGTAVDLYELYWADFSRLQPGGIRILSASYQLLFHLSTLARDLVDHVAMATGCGGALRILQWLHAWSAWLIKGPAALLQLTMLLLVAFGTAAFVPPGQHWLLLGMVISTALLSVVLWSVVAYVTGLWLDEISFEPAVFGAGYRSGAIFMHAQVQDVGSLFTPLVGLIGALTLVALAPSVREEIAPGANPRSQEWTARLGRWWTAARAVLRTLFGTVVPLLALAGGAVYLSFLLEKLFGLHGLLTWLDTKDEVLVTIGKWLAGGAVTVSALGARFTQTFGKLRVALDAVLDIDNYFLDPADRRPPRARIFSRFAALLDYVRVRGYARVVIVAHSQGTVISADLLRYLQHTNRLHAVTGGAPLTLITLGSPLRDLYGGCFPLLYLWLGAPPASFAEALPPAAELGLVRWVNAYRSGDYVGRSIWTPADASEMFRVAQVHNGAAISASRADDRVEFCLGAGAHTHYFSDDAVALEVEIDRAICDRPTDRGQPGCG